MSRAEPSRAEQSRAEPSKAEPNRAEPSKTEQTLRQRIDGAMAVLYSLAHVADLGFSQTHGGASRKRDSSNMNRWGNGYSAEAKRVGAECKRRRRMVEHVRRSQYDGADALRQELLAGGIMVTDARADLTAAITHATGTTKRKRAQLQGKLRTRYILGACGESAKSQRCKQRAVTKRDANAVMERVVRGAIATMAVGTGDATETLTSPGEVARECSEWSDRRMILMQAKWFQRLNVTEGHAVWTVGNTDVVGGAVTAIDDDGHYTVAVDGGGTMPSVYRQNVCLKWQVGADMSVPAEAAPGAANSLRASLRAAEERVDADRRERSDGAEGDTVSGAEALAEVPTQEEVWQLAALDRGRFDDTALLFRRGAAGRG